MGHKSFAYAKANARPDCPKCNGAGTYMYDHNHGKICELCCQHDQGWWQLTELHSHPGKWCCKGGCGYISPTDPPEADKWRHTYSGWVRGTEK